MKRLILVEPGLVRALGHEQAHARVLRGECAKRSIPFLLLANRNAENDVAAELAAERVFHISVYATPQHYGLLDILRTKRAWARRFKKDFSAAFDREGIEEQDLILLNTVNISVLDGLRFALAPRRLEQRPATAVVLRLGAEEGLPGRRHPHLSRLLYRRSILMLSRQLRGRLLLAADANAIGSEFSRLTNCPVADIPLPISVPEAVPPRQSSSSVTVVFPSSAYAQKGFSLLPDALQIAMRRRPELRATIRIANPPAAMEPVVNRLQAMAPQVRLIHGSLPEERFYQMLSEADGVVLPYDPIVFAKRSSQILAQTAALGRPVIVIAGSCLDKECRAAGIAGIRADAYTAPALGAALERFVAHRDTLVNAAWAVCSAQRTRHSASAFVEQLLAHT